MRGPARHTSGFLRAEMRGGGVIRLVFRAGKGELVLDLPLAAVGDLLAELPAVLPPPAEPRRVRAWHLEAGPTLTLQTAEGHVAAYRITETQLAGLATLATYGNLAPTRLH